MYEVHQLGLKDARRDQKCQLFIAFKRAELELSRISSNIGNGDGIGFIAQNMFFK
jgi:hypothetical protein